MSPTALLVAYDGTEYSGWQVQPGRPTIQGVLQRTLESIHGSPAGAVTLSGAGRTDAGVHATGQVASYAPPTERSPAALLLALGGLLPEAIRVLDVWAPPAEFHARRSAVGKVYRFRICNRPLVLPFELRWSWWVRRPLSVDAMREAAAVFVGRHDFAGLASAGGQTRTTVRTVRRVVLSAPRPGSLELEIEADGFLYRMVRNLAGFLVEVGLGRRAVSETAGLLAAARRPVGVTTAPARGLCLVEVLYPPGAARGGADGPEDFYADPESGRAGFHGPVNQSIATLL